MKPKVNKDFDLKSLRRGIINSIVSDSQKSADVSLNKLDDAVKSHDEKHGVTPESKKHSRDVFKTIFHKGKKSKKGFKFSSVKMPDRKGLSFATKTKEDPKIAESLNNIRALKADNEIKQF